MKNIKEKCNHCGQIIDKKIWFAHTIKRLKKEGLPSLAKLIKMVSKSK